MSNNKSGRQMLLSVYYLLAVHILSLLTFSIYRVSQYLILGDTMMSSEADKASDAIAFFKGIHFDNVTSCYVLLLPAFVLLSAAAFGKVKTRLVKAVSFFFCIFYSIMFMASASNIPYFDYFFKNINASVFDWTCYIDTTVGMIFEESSFLMYLVAYIIITSLYICLLVRIRKIFCSKVDHTSYLDPSLNKKALVPNVAVVLVVMLMCSLGARGGMQKHPIKTSEAYYCNDSFLNQLGINPAFNFIKSYIDRSSKHNQPLNLTEIDDAVEYTSRWYGTKASKKENIMARHMDAKGNLKGKNVVFILMESMSASFMKQFGNKDNLTPNLDSLFNNSLAFSNFYSAGIHTAGGIVAALYSTPVILHRKIMKGATTPVINGIPSVLHENGYRNMFFMAHEKEFDNMNAFLLGNGYSDIYSMEDYPESERVNRYGVSDNFLFNYALSVINRRAEEEKPFFATILSITNHPPFILPKGYTPRNEDVELQVVEYADWSIGNFFRKARKESWYDNTVFVIVADHGKLVGQSSSELPESYNHIPLMIIGSGMENQIYDGLGTQVDIMPTLLGLMGMEYDFHGFGVDLLSHRRDKVFYSADNQIVGRDYSRRYIYNPEIKKDFCYDYSRSDEGSLVPFKTGTPYDSLRTFSFSMMETADYMQREMMLNNLEARNN